MTNFVDLKDDNDESYLYMGFFLLLKCRIKVHASPSLIKRRRKKLTAAFDVVSVVTPSALECLTIKHY